MLGKSAITRNVRSELKAVEQYARVAVSLLTVIALALVILVARR